MRHRQRRETLVERNSRKCLRVKDLRRLAGLRAFATIDSIFTHVRSPLAIRCANA
jgi:hypothetical protein